MRRSGSLLLTGVAAALLVLATGCGTEHAGTSAPSGPSSPPEASAKPSVPECPQIAGVAAPSPCVSVGAEQNQQANQTFNSRESLPAPLASEAATATGRIRTSLDKLTPAQRLNVAAVRSALLAGGMVSTDLVVFRGSAATSVAFGGYEPFNTRPAVCAWGMVGVKSVEVQYGGNTLEGGCLPTAGGH